MKYAAVEEFLSSRPGARDCLALLGLFQGGVCSRMLAAVSHESDPEGAVPGDMEVAFERILDDAGRAELLTRKGDHWFAVNERVEAGLREIFLSWPSAQREPCESGFVRAYAEFAKLILGLNGLSNELSRRRLHRETTHLGRAVGFAVRLTDWAEARVLLNAMRLGVDRDLALDDWLFVLQEATRICSRSPDSEERRDFWGWLVEEQAESEFRAGWVDDALEHALALEVHQGEREDDAGLLRARCLLGRIAYDKRSFAEAEAWFQACLKSEIPRADSERIGVQIVAGLGKALARRGRPDEAEPHLTAALLLAQERDDETLVAEILLELSETAERRGDYDLATGRARRCLVAFERLEDEAGRANVLTRLGSISLEQNRLDDAERFLAESLALWKRISPGLWIADAIELMGRLMRLRDRPDASLSALRDLRDLCDWRDDRSGQAVAEIQKVRDRLRRRRYKEAHELLRSCIGQLRVDNDRERLAWALQQLGRTSAILETFWVSKKYFEECIEILKRDKRETALANVHYQFGKAAESHRNEEHASRNYSECLRLARIIDDKDLQSKALVRLSEISLLRGESDKAQDYGALNLRLQMRLRDESGIAGAKFQFGRIAMVRGEFAAARDRFTECVEACLAAGNLKDVGTALKHLTFACELAARNPEVVKVCDSFSNPDDFISKHWETDLLGEVEFCDETPLQLLRKCLAAAGGSSELLELRFLTRRLPRAEIEALASSALLQPRGGDDGAVEAAVQRRLSEHALDGRDWSSAVRHARRWLAFEEVRGAQQEAAQARQALGVALEKQGRVGEALKLFRASLVEGICFESASRCHVGDALCSLGREALFSGDIRRAMNFFERAHDHFKKHKNRCDAVPALLGLCRAATAVGAYGKARMWVDLALEICAEAGARWRAAAWREKARLHLQEGRHGASLLDLARALKVFRKLGDLPSEGEVLMEMGDLSRAAGNLKRAREHFTAALFLFENLGDEANRAVAEMALRALE